MRGDSAQLPVDFLVGFTIFILSLIMVANFVPSLLVGLQRTSGIDYDAVAYRTGVVLVEDPGDPAGGPVIGEVPPLEPQPWELQLAPQYINRLGLAYTRGTPNILSINKIDRFFCTTFLSDTDYRDKLLFSSYQYGYNITLQNITPMKPGDPPLTKMLGPPYPASYGYIRRYVAIKHNTNATIDLAERPEFNATRDEQVKPYFNKQQFRLRLDGRILYNVSIDTPLKIDLQREPLVIKISNVRAFLNRSDINPSPIANSSVSWALNTDPLYVASGDDKLPENATLTSITFCEMGSNSDIPNYATVRLSADGETPWVIPPMGGPLNKRVNNTVELFIDPLLPAGGTIKFDYYQGLDIVLTFENNIPHTLLSGTFYYDYNPRNVTRSELTTGMLEVGIW